MSHRSLRSTLVPFASGLAAVIAVAGVPATTPAFAAGAAAANAVRAQEWWLADLHVTQAWPRTEGAGVTVAVLGTGVAAGHPDLTGQVITGPDYTGSGRTGRRAVLGYRRNGGGECHRRPRARRGRCRRDHGRRARGENPVDPGEPGIQRPAQRRPGADPAAARRHRQRHHVRGRSWRPGHRPAARPGHVRAGRPGIHRGGRRQPGRAGRGRLRAAPGRRAGGPGGR